MKNQNVFHLVIAIGERTKFEECQPLVLSLSYPVLKCSCPVLFFQLANWLGHGPGQALSFHRSSRRETKSLEKNSVKKRRKRRRMKKSCFPLSLFLSVSLWSEEQKSHRDRSKIESPVKFPFFPFCSGTLSEWAEMKEHRGFSSSLTSTLIGASPSQNRLLSDRSRTYDDIILKWTSSSSEVL